jgi:hypothetical protein
MRAIPMSAILPIIGILARIELSARFSIEEGERLRR